MNGAITAGDYRHRGPVKVGPPPLRPPSRRDVLLFFVVLPLLFAAWATALGIGPSRALGLGDGALYVLTQVGAAWGGNALACFAAAGLLRRWRPPLWVTLAVGYGLGWFPLYAFYLEHFAFFSALHPEIVPMAARPAPGLTSAYLLQVTRFSLPFLPIWFVAVYAYRYFTGVLFFHGGAWRAAANEEPRIAGAGEASAVAAAPPPAADAPARVAPGASGSTAIAAGGRLPFLADSRLPEDAAVIALEAEEHYVKVWTDRGTDLVRYRFRDAVDELAAVDGARIHRSWWINWAWVTGASARGRAMNLTLRNGLTVPVSLAHKAEAERRARAAAGSRPVPSA